MNVGAGSGDVFAAIAAPARRAMLAKLATREMPVSELAASFDMTLSAVSQHLSILRDAGLVAPTKKGRQRVYRLEPQPLQTIAEWLAFYEPFWNDRLHQLGQYLEEHP